MDEKIMGCVLHKEVIIQVPEKRIERTNSTTSLPNTVSRVSSLNDSISSFSSEASSPDKKRRMTVPLKKTEKIIVGGDLQDQYVKKAQQISQ